MMSPFLLRSSFCRAVLLACLLAIAGNAFAQIKDTSYLAASGFPAIRVTLSHPTYTIHADPKTGEPKMPKDVAASAVALNWPANTPAPTEFSWRVYLDWSSEVYPTHHRINNQTFQQASPLKINLDGEIRGGQLTVIAKALLNGQEVCGQARALVLGENPPRQAVLKAFPRTRFGLIASKIGTAESGLRQFTLPNAVDAGGMPVMSRTYDIGIMQINAPSHAIASPDEVWDWRANVRRGLEILKSKRRTSQLASRSGIGLNRMHSLSYCQYLCLNCARAVLDLPCLELPTIPSLSEAPGSGALLGDPDPDHLLLSQVERDAIRRYNGGREYSYTLVPDPYTLGILAQGWQLDTTRGGIRPTSGDPNYVRHVLLAHSGLTLPPPPQPAHARHRRARRRHHHAAR